MAREPDVNVRAVARAEVVTVYAVGLFQGFALVAFPAASSVLTGASDYDALAAFWAAVTIGRLLISIAPKRLPSTAIYLVLRWGIAGTLLLVAALADETTGSSSPLPALPARASSR